MDGIFEELLGQLVQGKGLETLARRVGATEEATADATRSALPVLFGALSRNAVSARGAQALLGAIERDHDGGILDDLVGSLAGGGVEGGSGESILGHVLGDRQAHLEEELGRTTGLDGASISKLLAAVVPLVMGSLGSAQKEHRMGPQEFGYELGRVAKVAEESLGERFGILGSLLDSDGDGRVDEGVVRAGKSLLSRLLRR